MKIVRMLVFAACAFYGAMIGAASLSQAAPMTGVALAAPAVGSLATPTVNSLPVEKTYWVWRRHYWHPYWHRWHYYRPVYWHRWHRWRRWHRWHRWHRW